MAANRNSCLRTRTCQESAKFGRASVLTSAPSVGKRISARKSWLRRRTCTRFTSARWSAAPKPCRSKHFGNFPGRCTSPSRPSSAVSELKTGGLPKSLGLRKAKIGVIVWNSYGTPMELLWSPYGTPMEYHRSNTGVPGSQQSRATLPATEEPRDGGRGLIGWLVLRAVMK
jgi:hypothetical protein